MLSKATTMLSKAKTMLSKTKTEPLATPPSLEYPHPDAMYYYSQQEKKAYIIITPNIYDTNKLYKYDIDEDFWMIFTSYPDHIRPSDHAADIDKDNELLYITHGIDQSFAILDLKTNEWHTPNVNIKEDWNCQSVFVPNSGLHVLGIPNERNNIHIKYDTFKQQFMTASRDAIDHNCYLSRPGLVYLENRKILLALGGEIQCRTKKTDEIWYCDPFQNDGNVKWKELMPGLTSGIVNCGILMKLEIPFKKSVLTMSRFGSSRFDLLDCVGSRGPCAAAML